MSQRQVPYATSGALSTTHYKLVTAIEASPSSSAITALLAAQLSRIQSCWKRGAQSPSATRHDLVLALYCLSQRPLQSSSTLRECVMDPFDLDWCLPVAVKLAGGGREATLEDRRIGYRACDELFTSQPHALKLLLINTISQDLNTPPYAPQAEARWTLGLRAASSPRLVSAELVPAIQDRVVELFRSRSAPIRRLALAALLALLPFSSSLLPPTRSLVLSALSSPSRPSSSKLSSILAPERDPQVLAALVEATSERSPAYPVAERSRVVALLLGVLIRIAEGEWKEMLWRYHGVSCGWLAAKVLKEVGREVAKGEVDDGTRLAVLHGVLNYVKTTLDKIDLAFGLLLSAFTCLTTFSVTTLQSLDPSHATTLSRALAAVSHHLQGPNPNLQFLALRCLNAVPVHIWADATDEGWGEAVWAQIMGSLQSRDASMRKETLKLLYHVNPGLANQHLARLEQSLASFSLSNSTPQARNRLISLLLEASTVVDITGTDWATRILEIVASPSLAPEELLDTVVVSTIDRFTFSKDDVKAAFAKKLLETEAWRQSLTLALVVAATAGEGATSEEDRAGAAGRIVEWLSNEEDGRLPAFKESLQEPFLLTLLRLASRLPTSILDDIESHLHSPDPSPEGSVLAIFARCRNDEAARRALHATGLDHRGSTLPGFLEALQQHLTKPPPLHDDTASVASVAPSPSSTSSRPLRYTPYEPPTSPTRSDASFATDRRREKRRDRERRGGNGGMGQSLMTPGALALIGVGQDADGDSDTDSELSQVKRSVTPVRRRESVGPSESPPADLLVELGLTDPFHDGQQPS